MSFKGVNINKLNGGLGGGDSADRTAVLVLGCGAIGQTFPPNTAKKLLQENDAEALGITYAHDTAQGRLDRYHIGEAFRLSPDTSFYVIAVPTTTKTSDLKNLDAFKAAVRDIEGINLLVCAGLAADDSITTAVTGAQLLADQLAADHIYLDAVLVEGVGSYLSATVSDNIDLRELESPNVSVVIGRDSEIAASGATQHITAHAAMGAALGMLMVRAVHENLGSIDIESKPAARKGEQDYSLTDIKTGRFIRASLSNGADFGALSVADQNTLDQLGYVYIGSFSGYAGYYFSNSHTCEALASDYCYIERNCIWNKAARLIRKTLIPRIRSKVEAIPATGYIKGTTIDDWSARCRKALEPMLADGNCADFDIYINPNQAAVSAEPFKIGVKIVADGVVHEFDIDLGFTNKI